MTSRFSIFPASAAKLLPRALMIGALLLVLLLLCQWVQYEFSAVQHIPHFDDFNVYRTAGLKALGHRTAYDVSGHFQFNYPPFAALVYAHTFAAGPLRATETFWYWSTIGLFCLVALWAAFRLLPKHNVILSVDGSVALVAAGDSNNVSIASFVWKRMTPLDSKIANLLALACVAGVLVMWRKRSIGESVAFALFSVTLANPVVWPYWLLLGVMYFTWVCGRLLARDLHPATFLFPILYLVAAQFQNHHFVEDGWMTEAAFVFGLGTIVALAIAPTRAATPHITALAGGFNE